MTVVLKRRGNLDTDVQRKGRKKTQGEDAHPQARERGFKQLQRERYHRRRFRPVTIHPLCLKIKATSLQLMDAHRVMGPDHKYGSVRRMVIIQG